MEFFERIKAICKENGISQRKLEKDLGLGNGASSKWKTSSPSMELLQKLSNYFNVSIDYLLSGNKTTEIKDPPLTRKDENDISKRLAETLAKLDSQDGLMFDGEALDDETKEILKISLEHAMRTAKVIAKEKFTSKKYKKI